VGDKEEMDCESLVILNLYSPHDEADKVSLALALLLELM